MNEKQKLIEIYTQKVKIVNIIILIVRIFGFTPCLAVMLGIEDVLKNHSIDKLIVGIIMAIVISVFVGIIFANKLADNEDFRILKDLKNDTAFIKKVTVIESKSSRIVRNGGSISVQTNQKNRKINDTITYFDSDFNDTLTIKAVGFNCANNCCAGEEVFIICSNKNSKSKNSLEYFAEAYKLN